MNFIEFLGMVISLAAVLFLVFRNIWKAIQHHRYPELAKEEEQQQEESLKNLLKSMNIDIENEDFSPPKPKKAPPPAPTPKAPKVKYSRPSAPLQKQRESGALHREDYQRETASEKRKFESNLEERSKVKSDHDYYQDADRSRPSRAYQLTRGKHSRQELIILQEILNPPKAFRR
jgi:hypothetical protein